MDNLVIKTKKGTLAMEIPQSSSNYSFYTTAPLHYLPGFLIAKPFHQLCALLILNLRPKRFAKKEQVVVEAGLDVITSE